MTSLQRLFARSVNDVGPDTAVSRCARLLMTDLDSVLVVSLRERVLGLVSTDAVFAHGWMVGETWIPRTASAQWLCARDVAAPWDVMVQLEECAASTLRRMVRSPQRAAVVVDAESRLEGLLTPSSVVALAAQVLTDRDGQASVHSLPLIAVDAADRLPNARRAMQGHGIHDILVFDGTSFLGALSDHDLAVDGGASAASLTCGDLIRSRPAIARIGVTVAEAARSMHGGGHRSLVVMAEDGQVAGLITRDAVTLALAHHMEVARYRSLEPEPTIASEGVAFATRGGAGHGREG